MINASEFSVVVIDDSGGAHSIIPGAAFPAWANVTNPLVVGDSPTEPAAEVVEDELDGSSDTVPPPRAGRGSGLRPWADYATANGVEFDEDAGRDEIVAACEDAGVAVD